jgi:hypothetical protein
MKSMINRKKSGGYRESLTTRLAAYSVMAGAALAFMPAAEGAIVPMNNFNLASTSAPVCEGFIQGQQVQSQKVRHHRHAGMHVLSYASCGSSSSGSGSGAGE